MTVSDGLSAISGHTFMEINEDVFSWYEGGTYKDFITDDLYVVPIKEYLDQVNKNSDKYYVYTFGISKENEQKILNFYYHLAENNSDTYPDYDERQTFDLLGYNCTDVIVEALKAGGIVTKDFDAKSSVLNISKPEILKEKFDIKLNAQSKPLKFYGSS